MSPLSHPETVKPLHPPVVVRSRRSNRLPSCGCAHGGRLSAWHGGGVRDARRLTPNDSSAGWRTTDHCPTGRFRDGHSCRYAPPGNVENACSRLVIARGRLATDSPVPSAGRGCLACTRHDG
jgi:hypothetical protein